MAQDEVRKHARYTELRAQEAKYMSVSFLRGEISKVDAQISRLQSSISDLTRQQTAAQQTISDYEKKSSVAKLFAGKGNVTQAQTTLERVRREIPIANGDLRRQQDLKQEYSQQLESLLLLQEQIRAVTPSKTPEYWNTEVNKLQAELSGAQKALPELTTRKNALHEEVRELERQQSQAKSSFDILIELGRKVRQEQDKLAEIKRLRDKENNTCSEQLEKEISFCIAFLYKPTSEETSLLFNELKNGWVRISSITAECRSRLETRKPVLKTSSCSIISSAWSLILQISRTCITEHMVALFLMITMISESRSARNSIVGIPAKEPREMFT